MSDPTPARPRCVVELEETDDGGVAVTISASRYHLQWHALREGALSSAAKLLAAPTDEFREIRLGQAFGGAQVLLVCFEGVLRLKILGDHEGLDRADLLEVTLSEPEARALHDAIEDAHWLSD